MLAFMTCGEREKLYQHGGQYDTGLVERLADGALTWMSFDVIAAVAQK